MVLYILILENKEQHDIQISTIMNEIIRPLIDQKEALESKVEQFEKCISDQEQLILDIKVQSKNDIKSNKEELNNEIKDMEIDVTKVKNENENIAKDQIKLHQKIQEV